MYVFGSGRRGWRGLSLGFTNSVGTGGMLDVCLCFGCSCVGGKWVGVWKLPLGFLNMIKSTNINVLYAVCGLV